MNHSSKFVFTFYSFFSVMAVGLILLLAPPGMTQGRRALMTQDVYTPIAQGYELIQAGKYEAAAALFKMATKIDMHNPFALNNLAAIEAQKGNYKEAIKYLQEANLKANEYNDKVVDVAFVGGLANAVKPVRELGPKSSIAPIIAENIAKLEAKITDLKIPEFEWPPPKASAFAKIHRKLLLKGKKNPKIGDVAAQLEQAFSQAGYGEKTWYALPGGFALSSRMEQFNPDGTPKAEFER